MDCDICVRWSTARSQRRVERGRLTRSFFESLRRDPVDESSTAALQKSGPGQLPIMIGLVLDKVKPRTV
jgi:hypothetical protein